MPTATQPSPNPDFYLPVREDWLNRRREPIVDPTLPIVDPHHHLWDRSGWRYLLDEFLADTGSGHNIVATVFVQARAMLRASGPLELRHVGETEFANGVAAMSASGIYGTTRHCAGTGRPARPPPGRRGGAGARTPPQGRGRPLSRHPPQQCLGSRPAGAQSLL